eukprot:NODE_295_length_2128_cov_41.077961_g289_i0.p1 GENE.NODE_295_length_2128_cov_41.077961_g289_i0~~NODE_295_length_2128_cov_41.077961_g289_i0.p1  ORF type:complete len:702 (+),score=149.62 NODE_295_length_2128_cov_41.077961_g289_i0:37-2106(+)
MGSPLTYGTPHPNAFANAPSPFGWVQNGNDSDTHSMTDEWASPGRPPVGDTFGRFGAKRRSRAASEPIALKAHSPSFWREASPRARRATLKTAGESTAEDEQHAPKVLTREALLAEVTNASPSTRAAELAGMKAFSQYVTWTSRSPLRRPDDGCLAAATSTFIGRSRTNGPSGVLGPTATSDRRRRSYVHPFAMQTINTDSAKEAEAHPLPPSSGVVTQARRKSLWNWVKGDDDDAGPASPQGQGSPNKWQKFRRSSLFQRKNKEENIHTFIAAHVASEQKRKTERMTRRGSLARRCSLSHGMRQAADAGSPLSPHTTGHQPPKRLRSPRPRAMSLDQRQGSCASISSASSDNPTPVHVHRLCSLGRQSTLDMTPAVMQKRIAVNMQRFREAAMKAGKLSLRMKRDPTFRPDSDSPPSSPEPALSAGGFVFGSKPPVSPNSPGTDEDNRSPPTKPFKPPSFHRPQLGSQRSSSSVASIPLLPSASADAPVIEFTPTDDTESPPPLYGDRGKWAPSNPNAVTQDDQLTSTQHHSIMDMAEEASKVTKIIAQPAPPKPALKPNKPLTIAVPHRAVSITEVPARPPPPPPNVLDGDQVKLTVLVSAVVGFAQKVEKQVQAREAKINSLVTAINALRRGPCVSPVNAAEIPSSLQPFNEAQTTDPRGSAVLRDTTPPLKQKEVSLIMEDVDDL